MTAIKSIWDSHVASSEVIIKTQLDDVLPFKCFAATNHLTGNHLFIFETSKNSIFPEFKNFKFKGLFIELFEFEEKKELHIFLLDIHLKDIFSLFIENIIDVISKSITENEALIETSNIVLKWKKLFDKINFNGLSIEQQKGLLGELLLINSILNEEISIDKLLDSWTGPEYDDKDFLFGSIGIEVKLTSSKLPKLKISSERQLDNQNLMNLFLILYIVEEVKDKGFSLNYLIDQIRIKIKPNQNALKFFNERLCLIGYFDEDFENYNQQYAIRKRNCYEVNLNFPRLVSKDLPVGLFETKYSIELSAIEPFILGYETILELIKR